MLTILGGGGWFPAHGRHTACALLREGGAAVMIDAGTGVGRLIERPDLLDGVERVDVVLTHFHFDHIAGLAYLPAAGMCDRITIWGPGLALYGTPTRTLLSDVSRQPFHPVPLEQQEVHVFDLPLGEFELAGVHILSRRQDRHSAPTMGLRFGDELAWVTDTAYDPDTAAFAAGCRVLAHEAWFERGSPRNPEIHSAASEAARIAREAGVQELLLIHLPPFCTSVKPLLAEAQAAFAEVMAADDGLALADLTI